MNSAAPIDLKGSFFTLSVLKLLDPDLDRCLDALSAKIAQAPKFFEGAPLVVDIEAIAHTDVDFHQLRQGLQRLNLLPVALTGSGDLRQKGRDAGWAHINNPGRQAATTQDKGRAPAPTAEAAPRPTGAMLIEQPVRSGQQIYARDSDLVVLGQVSNGAEVIADGSIHIYGTLRGRAIAGAKGDTKAKIFCHNLQPELIAICGTYWLSDALQSQWGKGGIIRLDGASLSCKPLA